MFVAKMAEKTNPSNLNSNATTTTRYTSSSHYPSPLSGLSLLAAR